MRKQTEAMVVTGGLAFFAIWLFFILPYVFY